MRLLPIATILCTLPFTAFAAELERVDVLETGIFTAESGEVTQEPDAPRGETVASLNATLVEAGTSVPATLGTNFGFRYVPVGTPEGEMVTLDFVSFFPEPGLADPAAEAPIHEYRLSREKAIGVADYFGYELEESWEAVAGTWRFEVWHDGRKLAERTFTLTAPE